MIHPNESSCDHCGQDESPFPQGLLVTISGILTTIGLVLGWMKIGPEWLGMGTFAIATMRVVCLSSPPHGKHCWQSGWI